MVTLAIRILGGIILVEAVLHYPRRVLGGLSQLQDLRMFRWGIVVPLTGLSLLVWANLWFLLAGAVLLVLGALIPLKYPYVIVAGAFLGYRIAHLLGCASVSETLGGIVTGAAAGVGYALPVDVATTRLISARNRPMPPI